MNGIQAKLATTIVARASLMVLAGPLASLGFWRSASTVATAGVPRSKIKPKTVRFRIAGLIPKRAFGRQKIHCYLVPFSFSLQLN
jgi:hypothetical protein